MHPCIASNSVKSMLLAWLGDYSESRSHASLPVHMADITNGLQHSFFSPS